MKDIFKRWQVKVVRHNGHTFNIEMLGLFKHVVKSIHYEYGSHKDGIKEIIPLN